MTVDEFMEGVEGVPYVESEHNRMLRENEEQFGTPEWTDNPLASAPAHEENKGQVQKAKGQKE